MSLMHCVVMLILIPCNLHFSNLSQAQVIGKLAEDIALLCSGSQEEFSRRFNIVTDLMTSLLAILYRSDELDTASKGLKKIGIALTDSITKHLMKAQSGDINVFKCLHEPPLDLSSDAIKKFGVRQLALILSRDPEFKVSQAVSSQPEWTYAKLPEFVKDVYTQLLLPLSVDEGIEVMQRVLEQQEVNWKALLSFTATVLTTYTNASQQLTLFVSSLLQSSLENCTMEGLITAFLLVRQACLEGQHVFISYQQWFGVSD